MEQKKHIYMAIDLKSFYASVECISRQLDPLTTNLVVADTGKTGENNLPRGHTFPEKIRDFRKSQAV